MINKQKVAECFTQIKNIITKFIHENPLEWSNENLRYQDLGNICNIVTESGNMSIWFNIDRDPNELLLLLLGLSYDVGAFNFVLDLNTFIFKNNVSNSALKDYAIDNKDIKKSTDILIRLGIIDVNTFRLRRNND